MISFASSTSDSGTNISTLAESPKCGRPRVLTWTKFRHPLRALQHFRYRAIGSNVNHSPHHIAPFVIAVTYAELFFSGENLSTKRFLQDPTMCTNLFLAGAFISWIPYPIHLWQ